MSRKGTTRIGRKLTNWSVRKKLKNKQTKPIKLTKARKFSVLSWFNHIQISRCFKNVQPKLNNVSTHFQKNKCVKDQKSSKNLKRRRVENRSRLARREPDLGHSWHVGHWSMSPILRFPSQCFGSVVVVVWVQALRSIILNSFHETHCFMKILAGAGQRRGLKRKHRNAAKWQLHDRNKKEWIKKEGNSITKNETIYETMFEHENEEGRKAAKLKMIHKEKMPKNNKH